MLLKLFSLIKRNALWLQLLPIVIVALSTLITYKKDAQFFPWSSYTLQTNAYTDEDFDKGISLIDSFSSSQDSVSATYTLLDSNETLMPFAGIAFIDTVREPGIKPYDYDVVTLTMDSHERQQGYLLLHLFIEGLSNDADSNSPGITIQKPFSVFPGLHRYEFHMDDFYVPDWWLLKEKLTKKQLDITKNEKLWDIYVDMNNSNKYRNRNSICIHEISFHKTYKAELFWGTVTLLIYYLLLAVVISIVKQHELLLSQRSKIEMPYKTIEVIDTKLQELKLIIDTVQGRFDDPEFSLTILIESTGLTQERITLLLSDHFNGATFKQYLNTMRIGEACRLLRESDKKVSEIALLVGYANLTHFNRMFKKIEHSTPSAFRSQSTA